MRKFLIIYILLSFALELKAQCNDVLDTVIVHTYHNSFTNKSITVGNYRIINNTSDEYVTWISPNSVEGMLPSVLIHDYFQQVRGDFNLVFLLREKLIDTDSLSVGISFMKIIKPKESFSYYLINDTQSFYKDRIVVLKKEEVERQIRKELSYDVTYKDPFIVIN